MAWHYAKCFEHQTDSRGHKEGETFFTNPNFKGSNPWRRKIFSMPKIRIHSLYFRSVLFVRCKTNVISGCCLPSYLSSFLQKFCYVFFVFCIQKPCNNFFVLLFYSRVSLKAEKKREKNVINNGIWVNDFLVGCLCSFSPSLLFLKLPFTF